jgi:uncharacterized membrane protein YgcG
VLFGELLLWGWVRRWRQERELANATRLLDLVNQDRGAAAVSAPAHEEPLTVERREQLLRQLAGALEGQDMYLNGHSRRVARHAAMIAIGMGLSSEEVARVRAAAAVHDVGKLLTPKSVLNKPDRLTDTEFEVIKRHPVDGAEMVAALGDVQLTEIVRHHHERLDGGGYPDRLAGETIPLGARIIAVADTFDAITSARPYRDAAPHQKAIDILRNEAGTQLDPDAVRAFLAYYSGSRPTVVWAIVSSFVRRVVSWLTGDPAAAATLSASKVAAATAATAAIGAAAAATPVPAIVHHARPVARVVHIRRGAAAHRSTTLTSSSRSSAALPASANAAATRATGKAAARARGSHAVKAHAVPARRGAGHAAANHAGKHPNSAGANAAGSTRAAQRSMTRALTPASRGTTHRIPAANPTPPGHVKTINGNGNAYGHYKTHGSGNGNGVAHAPAHPTPPAHPAPPAHPSPAPPHSSPAPAHSSPAPAHAAPARPAPPAASAPPAAAPSSASAPASNGGEHSQNGNSQGGGAGDQSAGSSHSDGQGGGGSQGGGGHGG